MQDKSKKAVAETIWLVFFNETLFKKGLISEAERNRMKLRIDARRPPASGKKVT